MRRRHISDMKGKSTRLGKRWRPTHIKRLYTNITRRKSTELETEQRCKSNNEERK